MCHGASDFNRPMPIGPSSFITPCNNKLKQPPQKKALKTDKSDGKSNSSRHKWRDLNAPKALCQKTLTQQCNNDDSSTIENAQAHENSKAHEDAKDCDTELAIELPEYVECEGVARMPECESPTVPEMVASKEIEMASAFCHCRQHSDGGSHCPVDLPSSCWQQHDKKITYETNSAVITIMSLIRVLLLANELNTEMFVFRLIHHCLVE